MCNRENLISPGHFNRSSHFSILVVVGYAQHGIWNNKRFNIRENTCEFIAFLTWKPLTMLILTAICSILFAVIPFFLFNMNTVLFIKFLDYFWYIRCTGYRQYHLPTDVKPSLKLSKWKSRKSWMYDKIKSPLFSLYLSIVSTVAVWHLPFVSIGVRCECALTSSSGRQG